mgnify:CR=1 FL=1
MLEPVRERSLSRVPKCKLLAKRDSAQWQGERFGIVAMELDEVGLGASGLQANDPGIDEADDVGGGLQNPCRRDAGRHGAKLVGDLMRRVGGLDGRCQPRSAIGDHCLDLLGRVRATLVPTPTSRFGADGRALHDRIETVRGSTSARRKIKLY